MPVQRLTWLFQQYIAQQSSPAEEAELLTLLSNPVLDEPAKELIGRLIRTLPEEDLTAKPYTAEMLTAIFAAGESGSEADRQSGRQPATLRSLLFRRRWWAAAAVLVLLSIGYLLLPNRPSPVGEIPQASVIEPGREGAVLQLADGSRILLDSAGNGLLATEGGSRVMLDKGQLRYEAAAAPGGTAAFNTMSTPKGRQFRLSLPDGSQVWLNAASSIRYPAAFSGSERLVQVTGEAYFEITPNARHPFKVQGPDGLELKVLGTQFNINTYADEPAATATLLAGSLQVSAGRQSVVLHPGQQAVAAGQLSVTEPVNVQQVAGWRHGFFLFDGANLPLFLRQLSRWYDVDVIYKGKTPEKTFRGKLGRNLEFAEILETLRFFRINYTLQGKTLIIE